MQVNRSHDVMPSIFDPISSHIPLKLKEKAWKGDFIDFHLLLKSARELANEQGQGIEGDLAVKGGSLAVVNKTSNPIRNIHIWSSAFMVYASVMLEKWPSKGIEFFKYLHTVRMAASSGHPQGWVNYDEQYRLHKDLSPSSSWDVVDMELWMLCVSTLPLRHYHN